jgi:hypothetical protein
MTNEHIRTHDVVYDLQVHIRKVAFDTI